MFDMSLTSHLLYVAEPIVYLYLTLPETHFSNHPKKLLATPLVYLWVFECVDFDTFWMCSFWYVIMSSFFTVLKHLHLKILFECRHCTVLNLLTLIIFVNVLILKLLEYLCFKAGFYSVRFKNVSECVDLFSNSFESLILFSIWLIVLIRQYLNVVCSFEKVYERVEFEVFWLFWYKTSCMCWFNLFWNIFNVTAFNNVSKSTVFQQNISTSRH